jgi:hypothetical protein
MTMRSLMLIAMACSLCACASMNSAANTETGKLNAAYTVQNDAKAVPAVQDGEAKMVEAQGTSKVARIYWFLAGR